MEKEILEKLYMRCFATVPSRVEALTASGSHRRYFRLQGSPTVIGVIGTDVEENGRFVTMSRCFRAEGLAVPEVLVVSDDGFAYLQEDLGGESLFDAIRPGRDSGVFSSRERELLASAIAALPSFQFSSAAMCDFGGECRLASFDDRAVMWDLNYFKYCFLKAVGIEFSEERLEDDFRKMVEVLTSCPSDTLMYRDFQSRNVMVRDGNPWFIDFQGARRGPCQYDVASFLWQAKAMLPDSLRDELVDVYLDSVQRYRAVDRDEFRRMLRHFVLFRTLQVLGTYGFRGYFERKPHFLGSVPYAIANLARIADEPLAEYPYIMELARRLGQMQWEGQGSGLTVEVMSFSYKSGLPVDASGNGGGFVFDCRAIHNPGRYDEYKCLTGRDEPVIRFLEEDGEVFGYLAHVYALVDASVERYVKRGFTHLMVCFGCTGGQHRSVYCAEATARHLRSRFGVNVELRHRESEYWKRDSTPRI
ncbi:MAG: phosphotransferase [Muribaculaceae bacterium]